MFHKEGPKLPESIRPASRLETVIGAGISIQGTLSGSGGVRLEGTFEGKMELEGTLVVGEQAKLISEEIRADSVSVAGTVQANLIAQKVHIQKTGKVWGDVTTGSLSTEEGGYLKGHVQMNEASAPAHEPGIPASQ
ncbi:MAG: polymer-forming cytoskeletal protein [Anaerolineales bacterium]|jgi:cytoskeletal protein CcmA (bactofilin family)